MRVLERNEHGFGERKEQGGTLMSEAVPFLWNLLPFWVADFLQSVEIGFGLFRIHAGKDKTTALNRYFYEIRKKVS